MLHGQECRLGASIGVAMFPNDGEDAATLLKNADVAMYRGKESGGNSLAFAVARWAPGPQRSEWSSGRAFAGRSTTDQLLLLYQPKVSIRTGAADRRRSAGPLAAPRARPRAAGRFIPLAEESGLIRQIARWVLHQACAQAAQWRADGPGPIRVAVNLSARQFIDGGLVIEVAHALAQTELPPTCSSWRSPKA